MPRYLRFALAVAISLAAVAAAHAQFYNLAIYSGGEFDGSPTNGGSVTAAANSGWVPGLTMPGLSLRGGTTAATWSNATSPGSGSTFAYNFNGNSGYVSGGMISSDYYNVGMELWVNLSFVDGNLQTLMHNGPSLSEGFGLNVFNGKWAGLIGGHLWMDGGVNGITATTNTWTQLALVSAYDSGVGGVVTTFYVNGVAVQSTGYNPLYSYAPGENDAPAPLLHLGSGAGGAYTHGLIDNARFFVFYEGSYNPSMLNLVPAAVPEPSTYAALAGLAALIVAASRRRRP